MFGVALPIMGGLLAQSVTYVLDGIMCARIPDNGLSLTALGFSVQVWSMCITPAAALGIGTVAMVSRAHGARDVERMNRVVTQSAQLALLAGGVLAILGVIFADSILRALGASPEVAELGAGYLRMLMIVFPGNFLVEGCLSPMLRSAGKARLPFIAGVAGNLLNVALNYGLIFGNFGLPEMGIAGAGLATAISQMTTLVILLVAIHRGAIDGVVVRIRAAVDRSIMGQIVTVGWPAWLERLAFFGSMTALVWILARVDETAVAAHIIGTRIAGFLMVPVFGLSRATGALTGKALGGGSPDDARKVFRLSAVAAVAIMLPIGVTLAASAYAIAAAYDVAPGSLLERDSVTWLRLISVTIVLQGVMLALEGVLLGAGATRTVLRINLWANMGLRVALATALGFGTDLGPVGVWLSWPASFLVQLPLAFIAYRRGQWAVTGVAIKK